MIGFDNRRKFNKMKRENYKEKRGKERVILNKRIKQKIAKRERERERERNSIEQSYVIL